MCIYQGIRNFNSGKIINQVRQKGADITNVKICWSQATVEKVAGSFIVSLTFFRLFHLHAQVTCISEAARLRLTVF
jgi:hypothetical protein